MLSVDELVKHTIIRQLSYGPCCRIHLHRECCLALDLSVEPKINEKNQRIRICKDLPDNRFDNPFNELIDGEFVQKMPANSGYVFYELTGKGKKLVAKYL